MCGHNIKRAYCGTCFKSLGDVYSFGEAPSTFLLLLWNALIVKTWDRFWLAVGRRGNHLIVLVMWLQTGIERAFWKVREKYLGVLLLLQVLDETRYTGIDSVFVMFALNGPHELNTFTCNFWFLLNSLWLDTWASYVCGDAMNGICC